MRVRTRRRALQTAVDTYRHPELGRTVTLVGMVHIADEEFYTEVTTLVEQLERDTGAEVHYELVRPAPGDWAISDVERDLVDRLRAARAAAPLLARLTGLALQQLVPVQPHWRNTDMNYLELLRALPDLAGFVRRQERLCETMRTLTNSTQRDRALAGRMASWLVRHLPLMHRISQVVTLGGVLGGDVAAVLVGRRNQIAISAAVAAPGDVVALWVPPICRASGAACATPGLCGSPPVG